MLRWSCVKSEPVFVHASNEIGACFICDIVMDVDTDALRWFQLVADGYTVTEVSDVFELSQPGVSRALARLEQEVVPPCCAAPAGCCG